jgi:hypothetical protein
MICRISASSVVKDFSLSQAEKILNRKVRHRCSSERKGTRSEIMAIACQ